MKEKRQKRHGQLLLLALLLCCVSVWQVLSILWPAAAPADSTVQDVTLPPEEPSPAAGEQLIALTFDDGPHSVYTPRLLDALQQRGVHATFFLIGEQVSDNAALVERMDLAGHQIGLHTFTHVELTELSNGQIAQEIASSRSVLRDLLGRDDFWLRPPYGITNSRVLKQVDTPFIIWSVDPEDWRDRNADRVTAQVLAEAQDGDIILMHDIFPESVEAAVRIVDELQGRGFRFVTVEELFAQKGVTPQNGTRYSDAR